KICSPLNLYEIKENEHVLEFNVEESLVEILNTYEDERSDLYIAATDNMAYGIIEGLRRLKKNVGKDVYVAGFGGYELNFIMSPKLTTVTFDYEKIGKIASNIVIDLLNGKKREHLKVLDLKLNINESFK
ncbi:MAG: substrate-binding domain-containing protein, partial [Tissierellia bacterium]|nr:substrate-binding domain-containing protein [Tissierellia bacterium]